MDMLGIIFIALLIFSVVANFLSIPGNFLIIFDTGWYGVATGFHKFSFSFLLVLLAIAIAVELLEYFIIAFGARKYGASKLGAVAGILGGIVGSVSGFFFSPVMGAIIGGFTGVIVGTLGLELLRGKNLRQAIAAAYGAILGRVGGLTVKALGSLTMVVIIAVNLFY